MLLLLRRHLDELIEKEGIPEFFILFLLQVSSCFYFSSRIFWPRFRNGSDTWMMIEYYVTALSPLYYPIVTVVFGLISHERALNFVLSILDRVFPIERVVYTEEEIERLRLKELEIQEEGLLEQQKPEI